MYAILASVLGQLTVQYSIANTICDANVHNSEKNLHSLNRLRWRCTVPCPKHVAVLQCQKSPLFGGLRTYPDGTLKIPKKVKNSAQLFMMIFVTALISTAILKLK